MPEVVKPDAPHSVLFQKLRKRLREIPRLDPLADRVDIDIVEKIFAVAVSAQVHVFLLLLSQLLEQRLKGRHKGKAPVGGLGFRPILCQLYIFAVDDGLGYCTHSFP